MGIGHRERQEREGHGGWEERERELDKSQRRLGEPGSVSHGIGLL